MTGFRHAILNALHECQRDRVKLIARNVAVRLPDEFSFSSRYVEMELACMIRDGLVERPLNRDGKPKRYGYVPKIHLLEFCPCCHQLIVPPAFAHAS